MNRVSDLLQEEEEEGEGKEIEAVMRKLGYC